MREKYAPGGRVNQMMKGVQGVSRFEEKRRKKIVVGIKSRIRVREQSY